MGSKTRLYRVTTPTAVRLIESPSAQRAIAHAANKEILADIPSQREIYELAASGIPIEVVGEGQPSDETRQAAAQSNLPV